jgi:hypothetical protein
MVAEAALAKLPAFQCRNTILELERHQRSGFVRHEPTARIRPPVPKNTATVLVCQGKNVAQAPKGRASKAQANGP